MKKIATIRTKFKDKFGIPRQSGIVQTEGVIVFEEPYRNPDALRGIEGYSHLWLIWEFSESVRDTWSPTVRPPRLGGNRRMGVFATRSPFRPNPIGLSSVRLLGVEMTKNEGAVLHVSGADLLDGTPIYDIKPYLPYTDSHPDAAGGFADGVKDYALSVRIPEAELQKIPEAERDTVREILANDPRPSYQDDSERIYYLDYGELKIAFSVAENELTVRKIGK
ncbi:MAG: tRNA (N6-threonylcarbamoyladenosine(37)-N6)-methyltransferase TrmO [Clostridia bacterium]|nr:tRNA (N6-threonylcarbamoyladenosine(37)-N6)-methyltransferase TrmO [Clostridia bacterium]